MKAPLLQRGQTIDYIPTVDIVAGTVVVQGQLVGVADQDIKANTPGSLSLVGIRLFPKAAGSIAAGVPVYIDSQNDVVTATAGSNVKAGITVAAGAADAEFVQVKIG